MKVWITDRLVEAAEARVSAFDHGLTVGDGVFETLHVVGGRPFALRRHLDRLVRSAGGLALPLPPLDTVRAAVAAVLAANPELPDARLRITVTGGPGPLGSDRAEPANPTLVVALAPLSGWPAEARVVTVPWTRNERGALAGCKTTSYADNVIALAYAHERGAEEAIFANTRGRLCEGTGSNVFVVVDGALLTPPLESGCLAGISRELLLEWLPEAAEEDLPIGVLAEADELLLTSTTRDVQPIGWVDGRQLAAPGPVTARARAIFAERAAADPDP